jgi:membrane-bound ClpP family serine protease
VDSLFKLEFALILLLLLVGMVCLFAEFFLFPGLTISGVLGAVCLIAGVILGYRQLGFTGGNVLFLGTLLAAGFIFRAGLRRLSSSDMAVHEAIDSKVNVRQVEVKLGDAGVAISALRPGGTARIAGTRLEVFTRGEFIDSGRSIEVVAVDESKVTVAEAPAGQTVVEASAG